MVEQVEIFEIVERILVAGGERWGLARGGGVVGDIGIKGGGSRQGIEIDAGADGVRSPAKGLVDDAVVAVIDDVDVGARTSIHGVDPGAAIHAVGSATSDEGIVSTLAEEAVVARAAIEDVVAAVSA